MFAGKKNILPEVGKTLLHQLSESQIFQISRLKAGLGQTSLTKESQPLTIFLMTKFEFQTNSE